MKSWDEIRAERLAERKWPYAPLGGESLGRKIRRLPFIIKNRYGLTERTYHAMQRAYRGYSDYDWWSFDTFLARIIATAMKDFRDKGHGYPMMTGKDGEELSEGASVAKWNAILTEIADGFDGYRNGTLTTDSPEFKRAMKLFAKWFGALWD